MPEGMISENHINARIAGLVMSGKKFVTIDKNLFYNSFTGEAAYHDIILRNCEKVSITDNIFHFPGNPQRTAVSLENGSRDNTIQQNTFNQPGAGVSIEAGVLNTKILDNRFFKTDLIKRVPLNVNNVVDRGSGTYIRTLPAESLPPGNR